jgi:hypothetical protein
VPGGGRGTGAADEAQPLVPALIRSLQLAICNFSAALLLMAPTGLSQSKGP